MPLLYTMHLPTNLLLHLTIPPLPLTNLLLPQLTSQPLPLMLSPRARTSPMPTSTELLMTTPRLTSMLLRLLMDLVLSQDLTPLLFLMVVPSMSSTPQTTTTDMSPRSHTRESPFTLMLLPMPLPLPTMLKPSLCFVNIYLLPIS